MSAFTAVTRPTRRDMHRHPWRSLAALLMIMVPVALIVGGFTVDRSTQAQDRLSDLDNKIALGDGGTCTQSVDGKSYSCEGEHQHTPIEETLHGILPGVTLASTFETTVDMQAGTNTFSVNVVQVSHALGVELPSPGEVYLPSHAFQDGNLGIGDTVDVSGHGTWTVAGRAASYQAVVAAPTLVDPATITAEIADPQANVVQWYTVGPEEMTWDQVLALNQHGFVATSSNLVDNPPPAEQVAEEFRDYSAGPTGDPYFTTMTLTGLFVGMVLLFLFITPVFSVAASKQARTYALMRAQGATTRHIRQAVSTYGLITGLLGATAGVVLGLGTAAAYWAVRYPAWPLHVDWPSTLTTWVGAVVGALVASLIPAVIATRQPLATAVAGGVPDKMLRMRPWMFAGAVLLPLGIAMLAVPLPAATEHYTDSPDTNALTIVVAIIKTLAWPTIVIGIAASAPLLVWLIARGGSSLSTVPRLAVRDLSRQALRSVPTLALIMAVSFVSVTAVTSIHAGVARENRLVDETFNTSAVFINANNDNAAADGGFDPAVAAVEQIVGPVEQYPLTSVDSYSISLDPLLECYEEDALHDPQRAQECYPTNRQTWISSPWTSLVIADENSLRAFNLSEADQKEYLASLDVPALYVPRGTSAEALNGVDLWTTGNQGLHVESAHDQYLEITDVTLVDVLPVDAGYPMMTKPLADELGLSTSPGELLVEAQAPITARQINKLTDYSADVSTGYSASTAKTSFQPALTSIIVGVAVLLLIVLAIALVLSMSTRSTNRHFALLHAVGAPPHLPRKITATYAATLAFSGTVAGVIAGHVAGWLASRPNLLDTNGMVVMTGTRDFYAPGWILTVLLVVATPLMAYLVGLLFQRTTPATPPKSH